MPFLVISSSLNPDSNSRLLAKEAYQCLLDNKQPTTRLDLRELPLPQCDGDKAYNDPNVKKASDLVKQASCILVALPVYNYSSGSVTKNFIELTGSVWEDKIVGFLCAAGGKSSYMSVMSLANSLMLDFRCLIIPRFVYADSSAFLSDGEIEGSIKERIKELVSAAIKLSRCQ